jgi:hypothetical protein
MNAILRIILLLLVWLGFAKKPRYLTRYSEQHPTVAETLLLSVQAASPNGPASNAHADAGRRSHCPYRWSDGHHGQSSSIGCSGQLYRLLSISLPVVFPTSGSNAAMSSGPAEHHQSSFRSVTTKMPRNWSAYLDRKSAIAASNRGSARSSCG